MSIEKSISNGVLVFAPSGELDEKAARELCSAVQEAAVGGKARVVVDFSLVDFVQSAGLGVMFSCLSPLRGHCRIGFAAMDENIGRVLERVGFLEMQGVCFFPGVGEAVRSFGDEAR